VVSDALPIAADVHVFESAVPQQIRPNDWVKKEFVESEWSGIYIDDSQGVEF
jgi:hypothetical protein